MLYRPHGQMGETMKARWLGMKVRPLPVGHEFPVKLERKTNKNSKRQLRPQLSSYLPITLSTSLKAG